MTPATRRAAIVIAFDHLPVGFLGCYGAEQVATPQFDRIASAGMTFDFCYARRSTLDVPTVDASPTPSSGTDRNAPGEATPRPELQQLLKQDDMRAIVHDERDTHAATADIPEVPEDLPLAGLLEHCHDFVSEPSGGNSLLWLQARGVPAMHVPPCRVPVDTDRSFGIDAGDATVATCLEALYRLQDPRRSDAPERHVATLRDAGLLQRGRLPESPALDRLNRALYAASVHALDACLASVRDALDVPPERQPLLIIAGMQGDSVARHPQLQDGCPPLVDEIVHVPLIVRPPGGLRLGQRSRALVQTSDIAATVRHWLVPDASSDFAAAPVGEQSQDLLRVFAGNFAERTAVLLEGTGGCTGLRTPHYSLLVPGSTEETNQEPDRDAARLFRKPQDVWDVLDVSSQEPEVVAELCEELRFRREEAGSAGQTTN
ncbi:Sulfatase [Maioricimonas rarisocia]|uniref:Sulfatase n=1 Tax=Maioricimonas rarisocia TaxID=2528026 RepID=A0A517Z158_9PLAN|nr:hypothetical protein [Maioricimonas rarisocia]QDU36208.1 Sulfatase [Maioricimonas rarisocia]